MTKAKSTPQKESPKWDERYLELAKLVGSWSKDPRAKVGAAIVNPKRGRLISIGFNGFPSNVEDNAHRLDDPHTKLTMTIHAEQNALIFAGQQALECDAYVVGKPVCSMCATLLIQAGIKRVVAAKPRQNTGSKWDKIGLVALDMLKEAGVEFKELTDADLSRLGVTADKPREALPPAGTILTDEEALQPHLFDPLS
ncbi:deoxycytidylate deaminase [Roseomonas nepalensis]|uniref:Deoxycytidylate deaminase n=1 Tax=Muricoccus nepalensis TaxID=1854500 RepID=A0A502G196_9PROT|nr:dCMP deaminase family protein [Roseomonas nepalensis]TPG55697.1 deoxycytidylate deaminase [Roseomonas nepalensis]